MSRCVDEDLRDPKAGFLKLFQHDAGLFMKKVAGGLEVSQIKLVPVKSNQISLENW